MKKFTIIILQKIILIISKILQKIILMNLIHQIRIKLMNNIKSITKAFIINKLILKIKKYEIYNLKINKMIITNLNKMIY